MTTKTAIKYLFKERVCPYTYEIEFKKLMMNRKFKYKVGDVVKFRHKDGFGEAQITDIFSDQIRCYRMYDLKSHGYIVWEEQNIIRKIR